MADDTHIKLERDEDIMKFINIGDEVNSDLELSEDGGSSIASSSDLKFENNLDFDGADFEYNWMPMDGRLTEDLLDRTVLNDQVDGVGRRESNMELQNGSQQQSRVPVAAGGAAAAGGATGGTSSFTQELLQRIKFGAFENPNYPFSPPEPNLSLVNFDAAKSAALPYVLAIDEFPLRSRVETQIKCRLTIRRNHTNELPSEVLLHLPSDTIARPRFQLMNPDQLKQDESLRYRTLWLSVEAINPEFPTDQILMCSKCLARERRRAFRKKAMDPQEETYWNGLQARRIVIFNCREVVPLTSEGHVELPLRIACYCRHHAARSGYQLIFALHDGDGQLLARTLSSKVSITDSHKDQRRVSTQSTASPALSGATTPSSVSSSQDSLPLTSSHIRRGSSSSSIGIQSHSQQQLPQQQQPVSHNQLSQHSHVFQQQHHPYMRPAKHAAAASQSSSAGSMGFQQLPSSQLTRQIQKLHAVPSWLAGVQLNDSSALMQQQQQQHQQHQPQEQDVQGPSIFRVIPHTGSVRGGVEVTLLGQGFQPGLITMFGDSQSINTQCWSDTTMIAQLPPSSQPGPVPVTIHGEASSTRSPPTFTYVNDGEDKLKEIALQMVGYKVTGKIEDAADIAQRIIMNDSHQGKGSNGSTSVRGSAGPSGSGYAENIAESAEQLALWVLHNLNKIGPGRFANLNLRNTEGQSMIHLATMLGYATVVKALIANGAYVDIQDVSGYTPLHFAVLFGNRNITRLLLMADADPFHRTLNGLTAHDFTDVTVEDLLPRDQRAWYSELNRRGSSSSIASMLQDWREDLPHNIPLTPEQSDDDLVEGSGNELDRIGSAPKLRALSSVLKKPPSYSQLFPREEVQSSYSTDGDATSEILSSGRIDTWAESSALGKAGTNSGLRHRRVSQAPVIDIDVSSSGDEFIDPFASGMQDGPDGFQDMDLEEIAEGADLNEALYLEHPRVFWNDRMLFTFWIPLALVTVLGILTVYVIQHYGRSDSNPLVTKIGDTVVRLCSTTLDRLMPMSRWNQIPSHLARPAQ